MTNHNQTSNIDVVGSVDDRRFRVLWNDSFYCGSGPRCSQPIVAPGVKRLEHRTEGVALLSQGIITRDWRFELLAVLDEPFLLQVIKHTRERVGARTRRTFEFVEPLFASLLLEHLTTYTIKGEILIISPYLICSN